MAHIQQFRFIEFIKSIFPEYFSESTVLEIGALDINGSVRKFFNSCTYTGIDIGAGKGVDIISHGEDFPAKANSYDVVLSCECMEHNPEYAKTWLNMIRVLKNNGLLIMTCATFGRKQHGTSNSNPQDSPLTTQIKQDYYRNLIKEDFQFVQPDYFFKDHIFTYDHSSNDLYFVGIGKHATNEQVSRFQIAKNSIKDFYEKVSREGLF